MPVIADDSGICIPALNNWPGVYTHRAIPGINNDEERNQKFYDASKDLDDKSVQFICTIVYYDGENLVHSEGVLDGVITSPRGENGFGFDPIFEVYQCKTLAELSDSEKNEISPRKKALEQMKRELRKKKMLRKIEKTVQKFNAPKVLVMTHKEPDYDALSSTFSICNYLKKKCPHCDIYPVLEKDRSTKVELKNDLKTYKKEDAKNTLFDFAIVCDVNEQN